MFGIMKGVFEADVCLLDYLLSSGSTDSVLVLSHPILANDESVSQQPGIHEMALRSA